MKVFLRIGEMFCIGFAIFGLITDLSEGDFAEDSALAIIFLLVVAAMFHFLIKRLDSGKSKIGKAIDKAAENSAKDILETSALPAKARNKKLLLQFIATILLTFAMLFFFTWNDFAGLVILGAFMAVAAVVLCFKADKIDEENLK